MEDYNKFSKTFANSRRNMIWPELEYFIDYLKKVPVPIKGTGTIKILDVWCGSGRLLNFLDKLEIKFDYLWVDSSVWMIDESKLEFPKNRFQVLDMKELYLLKEKFDIIFFIASFHHLKTKNERIDVLYKTRDLLNQNWKVFFTNWNLLGDKNFKKYENSYLGRWDFQIKIWEHSRYYHGFEIEELQDLFQLENFEIIENRVFDNSNNIISIIKKNNPDS